MRVLGRTNVAAGYVTGMQRRIYRASRFAARAERGLASAGIGLLVVVLLGMAVLTILPGAGT